MPISFDCRAANARYTEMPTASRTALMKAFVQGFSGFLVSEQPLRMLHGTTRWSYYANPNIP